MPMVKLGEVSRSVAAMVESAPVVALREAAAPVLRASVPARLRAQLPNGATLKLECGGRDCALVKAMIGALPALRQQFHDLAGLVRGQPGRVRSCALIGSSS